jgi:hypothetical protein
MYKSTHAIRFPALLNLVLVGSNTSLMTEFLGKLASLLERSIRVTPVLLDLVLMRDVTTLGAEFLS